jgi:GTP-binding protein
MPEHAGIPRIAIVGRPNVGKSSIMNMLAGAKVSIVDPTPGITRDRVTTLLEIPAPDNMGPRKLIELTDTGGFGVYTADGARFDDAGSDLSLLTADIERQIATAVERADMVLLVIDAQAGITALDQTVAKLLRERSITGRTGLAVPVQVVANKVDGDQWEPFASEAAELGFGEPWLVSAATNFRRADFRRRLYEGIPSVPRVESDGGGMPEMKLALVGRRNAGKSSFVNALAGEDRVIVSEIPGTTRDAIDVRFEIKGRKLLAIDTAGVRKRTKFHEAVELWALRRMEAAVQRADVVLLLIDATEKVSGVDKRLGRAVLDTFKPCIIVVTKWDLVEGRTNKKGQTITPEHYMEYLQEELPGLSFCPIAFSSAVDRVGFEGIIDTAFELFEQARTRVSTSELNRFIRAVLDQRGPSSALGTRAKVMYVSQVGVEPPTIVMVVNKLAMFVGEYERFLLNRLREATPFAEVPIRLILRERKRAELQDLLSGAHAKKKAAKSGPAFGVEGVEDDLVDEALADTGLDDFADAMLDDDDDDDDARDSPLGDR